MRLDNLNTPAGTGTVLCPGDTICRSDVLVNGGHGQRFMVATTRGPLPAFVVRYQGKAHAFLNRCAYKTVELDWNEGEFFSAGGDSLICATHGAQYHPASGACVSGPCNGNGLVVLEIEESEYAIRLVDVPY